MTKTDDKSCDPKCDGKECGSNGCNGNCGICGTGKICNSTGKCVDIKPNICNPKENCRKEGRICGPDGCGGSCDPGCFAEVCKEGKCIKNNNFPDDEALKYKIILKRESECVRTLNWLKNNFQLYDIERMQLYI